MRKSRRSKNKKPHLKVHLRDEYRNENGRTCELWNLMVESKWSEFEKVRDDSPFGRSVELHHVIHNARSLYDHKSNFILLSACIHKPLMHNISPIEGTIACWAAKYRKRDLDVAALHAMCNVNVIVWLQCHPSSVPFFESLRLETIEGLIALYPEFDWSSE